MVIGSAQGVTRQASGTLIVTESPPSEGETTTTSVETTSTTPLEPTTVTVTEQSPTPMTTKVSEEDEDAKDGFDITDLVNPLYLMVIIIVVLATALITTMLQRRRTLQSHQLQPATQNCANCGEPLTPGKPFCSSCGEKQE
jgi:hypothetical protein